MSRYIQIGRDLYDLQDGSLDNKPRGEIGAKKIWSAEALLNAIEGMATPTVIYPLSAKDCDRIAKQARWY